MVGRGLPLGFALAFAFAFAGCTVQAGQPTSTVTLRAAVQWPQGQNGFQTHDGYEIRVDSADATVGGAALSAFSGGGGSTGGTFDEANPPPGCTLCHGGHCHCGGQLISYEDLSGGTSDSPGVSGARVAYTQQLPIDALQGGMQTFAHQDVPEGEYNVLTLGALRLEVRGAVTGGGLTNAPFVLRLSDLVSDALSQQGDVAVSNEHPPVMVASMDIGVPDGLFEGVVFEQLEVRDGALQLDAAFAPTDVAQMRVRFSDKATGVLTTQRRKDLRVLPPLDGAPVDGQVLGLPATPPWLETADAGTAAPPPNEEPDPNVDFVVDGCEHLGEGPDLGSVTSVALRADLQGAPAARWEVEHGRTVVSLAAAGAGYGGWLTMAYNPAAPDSLLWVVVGQPGVSVSVYGATPLPAVPMVDLVRTQLPGACGSQPEHVEHLWVFQLPAGTYAVELRSTDSAQLVAVAIDSGEEE